MGQVSHGLARHLPAHLPVSVSPSARTGSCSSLPISCLCRVFASPAMGEANPSGHRLPLLLPVLGVQIPEPCKDKSVGAELMAGPHGSVGLHSTPGDGVCRPGLEQGELPALCPPWQSPGTREAGGTLPLGNISARFPGNLKQSKSSPRHASPSSVAGGHWGKLRGKRLRGIKPPFCSQVLVFPNPWQRLHQRLQLPRLALSVCTSAGRCPTL